jgi:ABC-2 type transport system ATP-binding protein
MDPIVVNALRKSYGKVPALRDVSFSVPQGTIFGLIGPDGGGKTTVMRSVVSLLSFDSGEVLFQGRPVNTEPGYVRAHVGYMPQRFSLYQDLTVQENLRFFGNLFRVHPSEFKTRTERMFEFSGLAPFSNRRAGALSGGMKQKLALSCMMVHAPAVVVLDEPTFGVDPLSRNDFWNVLKGLRDEGTTILVSTGYMDEAMLCDHVAFVHEGRILAHDAPAALPARFTRPLFLVETPAPHRAHAELAAGPLCLSCTLFGEGLHLTLSPATTVAHVSEHLRSRGVELKEIRQIEPGLEDLFLALMEEGPK